MVYVYHHTIYGQLGRLTIPFSDPKEARSYAETLFRTYRDEVLLIDEAGKVLKQYR